jgi:hypothetical protein
MSDTTTSHGRGWGYAGALLGGLVSIAANVAHSYVPPAGAAASWRPPLGDVVGAVFWPVALFVAIEILVRTNWPHGGWWVVVRFLGLLPVAVVAALVSYFHLSALLAHYGESALIAHLGPLAVDGLMVMASSALMATAPGHAVDALAEQQEAETTETSLPPAPVPQPAAIPLPTEPITTQKQVIEFLETHPRLRAMKPRQLWRTLGELCKAAGVDGPSEPTVSRALKSAMPVTP